MSGETNDSSVGVIEKVGSGNGDGDRKQEEGLVNTAFPQMVVSGVPRVSMWLICLVSPFSRVVLTA